MKATCNRCGHHGHSVTTAPSGEWLCELCTLEKLVHYYCATPHCKSGSNDTPVWSEVTCPVCLISMPIGTSKSTRPSWDEYFMGMAVWASKRATCDRRHVGCVIVTSTHQVVCTGYNGSAPGASHCDDVGHLMHDGHCVRTIHAEANAIAQAAQSGKSTAGCTIYVTCHPCPICLMLLAASGVTRIVYLEEYHPADDDVSHTLAEDAAIIIRQFSGERRWE